MFGCYESNGVKKTKTCLQYNTIQSDTMCLTDSSHDYIFNKIKRRDTIEYERKLALMMVVNDCNSIMI